MRRDELDELMGEKVEGDIALGVRVQDDDVVGLARLREIQPSVLVKDGQARVWDQCEILLGCVDDVGVYLRDVDVDVWVGREEELRAGEASASDEEHLDGVGVD